MPSTFGVVDLFAGPGGLGEGFAALDVGGHAPFRIGISVEKEPSAHRTLTLRAFLRAFRAQHDVLPRAFVDFHAGLVAEPDWAGVDPAMWSMAIEEARCLELGTESASEAMGGAIRSLRPSFDDMVLIGGPPCQAYSLVGRARSRGKQGYVPEHDERHYLFREYLRVLGQLKPAAFVMENVKGMLSSTVASQRVFEMLMEDLATLGKTHGEVYELRAIRIEGGRAVLRRADRPADFVVRSEDFGVPQRRHRVIIVGLRADVAGGAEHVGVDLTARRRTVEEVIGTLPGLRSRLSRGRDGETAWIDTVVDAAELLADLHRARGDADLDRAFSRVARRLRRSSPPPHSARRLPTGYGESNDPMIAWLERRDLCAVAQHETRGHMAADLRRYLFAATFGQTRGVSPKAADFPDALSPEHRNWHSGDFADRFRVQLAGDPSTTVTSHISKDGHYFIHPDPEQCRSLTVREAARLQTFPDDYLFLGTRTQQYVQVGNAVPPLLARHIAQLLHAVLEASVAVRVEVAPAASPCALAGR